jgi:uncharacterized protein (DUF433 family)
MVEHDEQAIDFDERIVVDPGILIGKPVVKGTRIPIPMILNLVAHGVTIVQIIEDYPILTRDDVRAAILYAGARLDREEVYALAAHP